MKTLIISMLMALGSFASAASLQSTQITIRPLDASIAILGEVAGIKGGIEVNGKAVVEDAIYITGDAAKHVMECANKAAIEAGVLAGKAFDATKQMIVITGQAAHDLIKNFGEKVIANVELAKALAVKYGKAIVIQTEEFARMAKAYAIIALENAQTYAIKGLKYAMAKVEWIANESLATAHDLAVKIATCFKAAVVKSRELAIEAMNAAELAVKSALIFINDAGVFVYNHGKACFTAIATLAENGMKLVGQAFDVAVEDMKKLGKWACKGIVTLYNHLPRVSVVVRIK